MTALPRWPSDPGDDTETWSQMCAYWEMRCRLAVESLQWIADGVCNLPRTQALKAIYAIGELPPAPEGYSTGMDGAARVVIHVPPRE